MRAPVTPAARLAVVVFAAFTTCAKVPAPPWEIVPGTPADAGSTMDAGGPVDSGATVDAGDLANPGTWFTSDAGELVWVAPPGPNDPVRARGKAVTVDRHVSCDLSAVGSSLVVAPVDGDAGEQVVITPSGAGCSFNLSYQDALGARTPLSAEASGWLVTVASKFPDGTRVVCGSEARSHVVSGSTTDLIIDTVPIRCWASASTLFTATVEVVAPSSQAAAWARELKPHPTQAGAYVLVWSRDFSFQFFNMSDNGRPSTDGVFESVLLWNGTTLVAQPAMLKSAITNPYSGKTQPYTPTDDEVARFRAMEPPAGP